MTVERRKNNMDYYLETTKKHVDGILYQAMVDETLRLRKSRNSKERSEIRSFILETYRLLSESNFEDECPESVQPGMLQ